MSAQLVITIGTFDIPHAGHLQFLKKARALQNDHNDSRFIVGVNSDEFVYKYKGLLPIFDTAERLAFVRDLGFAAGINDSAGKKFLERYRDKGTLGTPRFREGIIVIGTDWVDRDYLAQLDINREWLEGRNMSLAYVPYTRGISTSEIRRRVREQAATG